MAETIVVEVVFALPDRQVVTTVSVADGTPLGDVISASRIGERFPGHPVDLLPVGIWGRSVSRDQPVRNGDRVEIYRPLDIEPREARRRLANEGLTMRGESSDG